VISSHERPLHAWASDHFLVPLPPGHPFPIDKYTALRLQLLEERTLHADDVHVSEPAPVEWLLTVHDPSYVKRAMEGALDAAEVRRIGMPWSPELVTRARAALFGTVQAARSALVHGVAGNLAGGTHHAFRDRGEGYCLFNDVAVAIALLRDEGHASRPFIADLDVHQGNGTASIFAGDRSVFTFSLHGAGNYPAIKETGSRDVELPDGTGDGDYLAALDAHLPDALDSHAPDLVFYQAGVDALTEDRFGRLALSHAGLAERDRRVFAWTEQRGVPIVVTLGGGYGRPLEASVAAHVNVWRAARAARDRRPAVHAARSARNDVHDRMDRGQNA
jgi:acetoin utilization deacetylase AcuC-like enzyme